MLLKLTSTASFEHLCVRISSSSKSVLRVVVYRTGSASSLFYKEFENTLSLLATYNEEVLILGDFNFHLEQSDNTDAQTFLNILRSHGFDSSTNQPTHNQGGWLDVIASRKSVNINYIDSGISDHKLLLCSCEMLKPPHIYRQLQIRRWHFLDTEKFISELKLFPLSAATSLNVDSDFYLYISILSGILEKMIPFKTVRIHEKPSDPWFDRECCSSKCLKRSLERIYMRTKSENDFAAWMGQKKLYKKLCRQKRRDYWNNKLSDPKNKRANIWSHINSVSGEGKRSADGIQPVELQSFLLKKVESARNSIQARENPSYSAYAQEGGFSRLQDVDEDELLKAIQRLPNKQCASDPLPTWLLKKISGMILPFVKCMVNQSFFEGIVPKSWKSAQVTPLLKKPSLDHNVVSSYRPISNLPVLSKLSERLVLNRVMSSLNNSNLLPTHQSAYRRHHSTETAVTKVYSDILGATDDGKLSLLILLDLSAAFDLVDHSILLKRLENTYGFDGLTLEWFKNYLSDRSFNVRCSGTESEFVDSSVGVPQGSVLGPLLFSLYTGNLEKRVLKNKLGFHQYADDTQIYGHCNNEGTEELQIRVSECVDEIASWMGANCLKLNSEKTEVIWFFSRRNLTIFQAILYVYWKATSFHQNLWGTWK